MNSFVKVIYSYKNSHVIVLATYVGRSENPDEDQNQQLDIAEIYSLTVSGRPKTTSWICFSPCWQLRNFISPCIIAVLGAEILVLVFQRFDNLISTRLELCRSKDQRHGYLLYCDSELRWN